MRTQFKWRHHNVFSMIESINKDLERLNVRPEYTLRLEYGNTLRAFGLTIKKDNIHEIGEVVHFALVVMFVMKDAEARYKTDMLKLIREAGKSFWKGEYIE